MRTTTALEAFSIMPRPATHDPTVPPGTAYVRALHQKPDGGWWEARYEGRAT